MHRRPHLPWSPEGAEVGCGAWELSWWPLAALPDVVSFAPAAFPPPLSLCRSQVPGAGEAPVLDSVRPLGSSRSQCDSLEASGRDPNLRAALSPPQRCPLLA